jgi:hypothetical protein
MKLSFLFASVAIAASLAACGGGGGSNDTAPVQKPPETALSKYTGVWQACTVRNFGSSLSEATISTANASGSVKTNSKRAFYSSADCTGPTFATLTYPDEYFDFQGTKTIPTGELTDKVLLRRLEGPVQIQGSVIYTNDLLAKPVVAVDTPTVGTFYTISIPTSGTGTTSFISGKGYITAITNKDFLYLMNGELLSGDGRSTLDSDGYPTVFDTTVSYKRKP